MIRMFLTRIFYTNRYLQQIQKKNLTVKYHKSLIPDEQVTESHFGVLSSYSEEDIGLRGLVHLLCES